MTNSEIAGGIEIRHCQGLAEFEACLDMERRVWGSNDVDVVPSAVFVVVEETGGQVLGAFDRTAGGKLIGFTLAMPGFHGEKRYLHSHMTAVLGEYQNRGVGRRLKLFQRKDALARGINLVEWTFDPLELRNAHFNIVRLGAIMRKFLPNVYGITTSPLHGSMPTDRLTAEWWLDSPRVKRIVDQGQEETRAGQEKRVQIAVPRNIAELRTRDREEALRVQSHVRERFQDWFGRGYIVTGLEFDDENGNYLLEPYETRKDLSA